MANYEGYHEVVSAPTISIDITSGTRATGYFNSADFQDPPLLPSECEGGLQKTFNFAFNNSRNGNYNLREEITPEIILHLPHKTNMQYMSAGTEVIQAQTLEFVRCGAYIRNVSYTIARDEQPNIEGIHYTSIGSWDLAIKAIDVTGNIHEWNFSKNAIKIARNTHSWGEQDERGQWKPHEEVWHEMNEQGIEGIAESFTTMTQTYWSCDSDMTSINCDIPFFTNELDLDIFLETGVMEEPEPEPEEGETVFFYIETNTIMNDEPKTEGATWVNHRRQEFTGISDYKMSRFYVSDVTLPINMKWKGSVAQTSPHTQFIKGKEIYYNESGGIESEEEYTNLTDFINPWHCGEDWHQAPNGKWYKSDIQTNIALVGSEEDDPQPPAPDPAKPNPTGEDDPSTVLPPNTLDAVGGRVYLLDSSAMNNFIDGFFDEDDTIIDELVKGLKMFGSDPTESIIDIYATPINLKAFCNVTNTNAVKVGNYIIRGINGCRVLNNRVLHQLGQVSIRGTYNDWRDLDANYILYLPYVGFINLDTEKYINRTFTIKMATDVHTGNIKYYLFSGGNVLDTYEGCVHMSCPLTNANYHNIPNKLSTGFNSILSTTTQVAGAFGGGSPLGLTALLAGGSGITEMAGTMAGFKDAKTTGNFSSELAVNDCNYPYLIIKQPEYLYPSRLYEEFGYPDDSIANLKEYKGYVQVNEVNLTTTATKAEIEEIESLLHEGVYI